MKGELVVLLVTSSHLHTKSSQLVFWLLRSGLESLRTSPVKKGIIMKWRKTSLIQESSLPGGPYIHCCIELFWCSLYHVKITASITRSSHQNGGLCYLHVPIFFLYVLLFCWKIKKLLWSLFSSADYTTHQCSMVYITILF